MMSRPEQTRRDEGKSTRSRENNFCGQRVEGGWVGFVEICDVEAHDMRRAMRAAVMTAMLLVGVSAAGAQMLDPSTGIMVDPMTDPYDYATVASGQPGNLSMEVSEQQVAQDQKDMQAQLEASQQDAINAMNNAPDSDDSAGTVPSLPPAPKTVKPAIAPKGGKVAAGTAVTISDPDAAAVVYYTTNGKKPTAASARYDGPIVVSAKEKVEAMAFDVNMQPSGVVTTTFKVKG